MRNKAILILIIVWLFLPSFSFAQESQLAPPETLEEAKEMGERVGKEALESLPTILKGLWEKEVLPIWQKMYNWFKINIWSKIEGWFKKELEPRAKEEIEKRKPIIEEEFQKEKEEVKEEAPKIGKSLWERFKELID